MFRKNCVPTESNLHDSWLPSDFLLLVSDLQMFLYGYLHIYWYLQQIIRLLYFLNLMMGIKAIAEYFYFVKISHIMI